MYSACTAFFFQFFSRRSFFLPFPFSVHSLARDDEGSKPVVGRKIGRISREGGESAIFSPLPFFRFSNSTDFSPEDVPIHGMLRHSRFGREGRIDDVLGIEFSENLRPERIEGCQGRGGRMKLAKAGDRFSDELVLRRRNCRWFY